MTFFSAIWFPNRYICLFGILFLCVFFFFSSHIQIYQVLKELSCDWEYDACLCQLPIPLSLTTPASITKSSVQFSCSVMSDSAIPWTAVFQASLSITNSQSLLKLMSIELMIPYNYFILCWPLLLSSISQHQGVFRWVSFSHQVAKVLELQLQHQYFQWIFRTDFL